MMKKFLGLVLSLVILNPMALAGTGDFSPSRSGAGTYGVNPSGFDYATFNNFKNNCYLSYLRWQSDTQPNASNAFPADCNRSHIDERDFMTARKGDSRSGAYLHTVSDSLAEGDQVWVFMYVHNNAKQGQHPANSTSVSLDWSNPNSIQGTIAASNTNPRSVSDIVTMANLPANFTFEPVGNTFIRRYKNTSTGQTVEVNVNYTQNGDSLTANIGNVVGSYANTQAIYFPLVVVPAPLPPSINIIKDDNQPNGSDPDGADTQTVDYNGTAAFRITVTNDGPVALQNVVVSDVVTPACGRTAAQTQALYTGSTFAPGDSFNYVCNATNVTEDFTNTARVDAVSAVDGTTPVNDSDPTDVVVDPGTPNINIDKDDSTPGTPDTDGNDSQTLINGDTTAEFTITVTNNGEVDLENIRINDELTAACRQTNAQTLPRIQAIGNRDSIFNVGERFSYECNATSVDAAFTNLAQVEGDPVNGLPTVRDSDTTEVLIMLQPRIDIDKDDSTPGTGDTDGNDYQVVNAGNSATFTITVTNTGPVALREVIITDPETPSCNRSANFTAGEYAAGATTNFDPLESFTYTCESTALTRGFTNVAMVTGISVEDGTQVEADDDTVVEVPPIVVAIDIDKDDSTPGDADTDGADTQTVDLGGVATFTITVTNTGDDDMRDIVVTDPNAQACDRNAAQTAQLMLEQGGNTVLEAATTTTPAESFTYTCTDDSVDGSYINTANVVGVGVTRGDVDVDSDPTTVETGPENQKIQILKWDEDGLTDADGADVQTIDRNGTANFTIQVTNTGNVGLERVSTGDELAPNCALGVQEALVYIRAIGDQDAVFDPNETFTYTCTDTNVADDYTNTVTVRGFSIFTGAKAQDDDPTDIVVRDPQPTCTASSFDVDTTGPGTTVTYSWTTLNVPTNGRLICSGAGVDIDEEIGSRTSRDIAVPATAADGDVITCRIEMPDGTELCRDTVAIETSTGGSDAEITIDKDDQDNTDDTQKINRNGTARFTITVTNTGKVDLTNVFVDDNRAANCVRTDLETAPLIAAIGNNDNIFNVGEEFTYECEQDEWNLGSNEATTRATPTNGDDIVTDEDSTRITFNGGGGGTPDTHPSVGVCSVGGGGYAQCRGQRPVENPSDPAWVDYYACTQGSRTPEECVRDVWAPAKGLDGKLCGPGGDAFAGLTSLAAMTQGEVNAECNPILPPLPPSCTPIETICPACFKQAEDITINKQIVGTGMVAKGELATYQIELDKIQIKDEQFKLRSLEVRIHDRLIPAESGWLYGRGDHSVVDGDGQDLTWSWNDSDEYFTQTFNINSTVVKSLNDYGELNDAARRDLTVHYDLNTDLVADFDEGSLVNVAFATIIYDYKQRAFDADGNEIWIDSSFPATAGIGDACDGAGVDLYELYRARKAAGATFGDTAELTIIRPFVQARGGNMAVRTNDKAFGEARNITGADHNQGVIVESKDNNIFGDADGFDFDATDLEDLSNDFRSDRDDYYENLEANMQTGASLPTGLTATGEVMTHTYDSGIYVIKGGEVKVTGAIQLTRASTFILQGASLVVEQNVEFANHFGAFVVREGAGFTGDIAIANDVTKMSGVYIAEGESRIVALGSTADTTHKLQVNGNLIGDLSHLLSFRKYIGTTAGAPEPSLIVAFDLRILESTPPILEQFLGQDWREGVSQ